MSDVIHGGDLVTTVCHSAPFIVDTTPPEFHAVPEFLFDETFRYLVVYFSASDVTSGVSGIEFGLGRTKYDVSLRPYQPLPMRGAGNQTYIVYEEFSASEGQPAWIRLKVINSGESRASMAMQVFNSSFSSLFCLILDRGLGEGGRKRGRGCTVSITYSEATQGAIIA